MEEIILPAEVWLNICEQLEKERDFQSLFNCALVKQVVAGAAVKSLYRYVQLLSILKSFLKKGSCSFILLRLKFGPIQVDVEKGTYFIRRSRASTPFTLLAIFT